MSKLLTWFVGLGMGQKVGLVGGLAGVLTANWLIAVFGLIVFAFSRAFDLAKAQKAGESLSTPDTAQAVLLPDEQKVFVRGVGYRQGELKSLGRSTISALLLPEPTNEYDENAIMVCSGIPTSYVQFGYLPKDFEITPLIGTLAEVVMERDGMLLAARCEIEQKADRSWIATIYLPHESTVEEMIG